MTKFHIRSFLLGGLILILPQGGFAQAPPSAEVRVAQADIAKYPNSTTAFINLATAESRAGHPDEAIAAASHALAMPYTDGLADHDTRPVAYSALAMAYTQKGDIANALSQVDAGLSRYPGSPLLSNSKGVVLIWSGQYSRAGEVLVPAYIAATHTSDKVTFAAWGYVGDDDSTYSALGFNAVISQYYASQYSQALEGARQLVALRELGDVCVNPELIPGEERPCTDGLDIASIDGHDVSGLPDSNYALKHFRKGPVGSVAQISLKSRGKTAAGLPKIEERSFVRQAVPLTKDAADDFGLLALMLNANGDREQALVMAQKAVALNPGSFWAELSYGLVLEDSNRWDEALKALESPTPDPPIFYRNGLKQIHLAVLYARKGEMAKAQELYSGNQFDPNCRPVAKEKDAFLALGQPVVNAHLVTAKQLAAQGKYAESLPEYAQALSFAASEQEASTLRAAMFAASGKMPTPPEMPDDAHRHVVRGELMLKDGNMDRALAEFNEALRMAPYIPRLYKNTALIYGELKQYDQAIRQMHLYLTAAPEAPDARNAQDQITKWEMRQEMEGKR